MRRHLFGLLCILTLTATPQTSLAQSPKAQAMKIQSNPDKYYWGSGSGSSEGEATEQAIRSLMTAISSKVSIITIGEIKNIQEGETARSESSMKSVFSLNAAGHLQGVHPLLLAKKPQFYVMAYITKEQLKDIYKARAERAVQFYIDAQNAEKQRRIDDALRCYFWAQCLINSVETPSDVKYEENMLVNVIPAQIKEILRKLKSEADVNGQDVKLYTTYDGNPVASVAFRYWDGLRLSDRHEAKDGMSLITMHSSYVEDKIQLNYELAFRDEAKKDPEMAELIEYYGGQGYKEAQSIVETGNKKLMKEVNREIEAAAQSQATPTNDFLKRNLAKNYTQAVLNIAEAIRKKQYASVASLFTSEGYEMFDKLLHYGNAEILTIPELHCFPYRDKVICRSIPMRFTYKGNKRAFVEDVTFTFNTEDKIESIAFGLDSPTREQIYTEKHLQAWGDSTCTMLASFLENYKTAFALHRLDYVRSIFDDNAVIITGHTLKQPKKHLLSDGHNFTIRGTEQQQVEYTRQSKDEYLQRLEKVFKANDFINLRLTDCYTDKMYDEHFGINIRQDYFSNTYCDTGFLFLYIDVSDPSTPTIQYRRWQPERDPALNNKVAFDDPRRGLVTAAMIQ